MTSRFIPAAVTAVAALALWMAPLASARAQTGADSAASAATGVYPARPTVQDSARTTDNGAVTAKRDSSSGQAVEGGPLVVNVAPPDTILTRACEGAPAGSPAPGLLAVVFRAGTADRDRTAAAKAVHGTLAGASGAGEEYVRLPADAPPLTVIADRLIRQDPVTRVSPAPCPPTAVQPVSQAAPTPEAPAAPTDSGAATPPDTASVPDSTAPSPQAPATVSPR